MANSYGDAIARLVRWATLNMPALPFQLVFEPWEGGIRCTAWLEHDLRGWRRRLMSAEEARQVRWECFDG